MQIFDTTKLPFFRRPTLLTLKQLERVQALLKRLAALIPPGQNKPKQRQLVGVYLFSWQVPFVDSVARALWRNPKLFADLPVDGQALYQQQRRAEQWRLIRDGLAVLWLRASDHYLLEQSEANQKALQVTDQVRAEQDGPFEDIDQIHRFVAVAGAVGQLPNRLNWLRRK